MANLLPLELDNGENREADNDTLLDSADGLSRDAISWIIRQSVGNSTMQGNPSHSDRSPKNYKDDKPLDAVQEPFRCSCWFLPYQRTNSKAGVDGLCAIRRICRMSLTLFLSWCIAETCIVSRTWKPYYMNYRVQPEARKIL